MAQTPDDIGSELQAATPLQAARPPRAAGRTQAPRPARAPQPRQIITAQGIVFVFLTLAIGLSAVNTGNNLSYLVFSVLISFLIVSGVMALWGVQGLEVDRVVPRHIHAGEPFTVTLILSNAKRFTSSYSLRAVDLMEQGRVAGACYVLRVARKGKTESFYQTRLPRRGIYRFTTVRIVSSFPFGFFRRLLDLPCPREILVYPQVLPFAEWAAWSPVPVGEHETPQKGMGQDLYGLRDYQAGDSARIIHWKLSARLGRLVAREFESEEKKKVTLLLDNGVPDPLAEGLGEYFEKAVVAAASLACAYLEAGYQTQLVTRSGRVPMASGHSHELRMLRSLAQVGLVAYAGSPLWIPPPSKDESHIAIHFAPGAPLAVAPNVQTMVIQETPPFDRFKLAAAEEKPM